MLVKQWFREYFSNDSTPEASLRIRYNRHRSLERWYVFVIAGGLPSLLQLALALFYIGLCIFAFQFHYSLFCGVLPVVAIWFAYYAFVLTAPLFSSRCPYKSPSLTSITQSLRRYIHHLRESFHLSRLDKPWSFLDPGPLVDESRIRISTEQDEAIWTEADSLFFDDKLVEETAHVCLASLEGPALVRCAQGVVQRRQHNAEPADLSNFGQDSVSLALVNALIRELRVQVVQSGRVEWKPWMGEAYGFMLDTWTYCSSDIGRNYLADFLIATLKQDWPLSEYILRWKPQHSLHVLSFALNDRNDRLSEFYSIQQENSGLTRKQKITQTLTFSTSSNRCYAQSDYSSLLDRCRVMDLTRSQWNHLHPTHVSLEPFLLVSMPPKYDLACEWRLLVIKLSNLLTKWYN